MDVAQAFAKALDREDYAGVAGLMDSSARYSLDDEEIAGPPAIVESYRKNGDWAARTLDNVTYESSVEVDVAGRAVITFFDHIEHAGARITHVCEQCIHIGDSGLVERIEHHDLPGQRERLAVFFKRVGVDRRAT